MLRFLRWLGAALLALLATVSSCIALLSRDLPDPGDADLLADAGLAVDPDEDGFPHLQTAIAGLVWPQVPEDFQRPTGGNNCTSVDWGTGRVRSVHEHNGEAHREIAAALVAPTLQIPQDQRELPGFDLTGVTRLARLLDAEAHWQALRGATRESLQAGLDAVRLGNALQRASGTGLLHMMVGTSLKSIGVQAIQDVLPSVQVSASDARWLSHALEAERATAQTWERVWNREYGQVKKIMTAAWAEERDRTAKNSVLERARSNPLWFAEPYTLQPNRTLARFADDYRLLRGDAALPCVRTIRHAASLTPWQRIRLTASRNGAGNILFEIAHPDHRRFQERSCLSDTKLAATATLAALAAYERDHGTLPESLDALLPTYMDTLPADGFEGVPLHYRPGDRLLYSIGSDGVDAHGVHGPDDDFTFAEPAYPIAPPATPVRATPVSPITEKDSANHGR